ncbi:hypothetical protein KM043_004408 [Ampulex compressa]|nr:hypothetical protein KM043_004408 [Ampulex compressa]
MSAVNISLFHFGFFIKIFLCSESKSTANRRGFKGRSNSRIRVGKERSDSLLARGCGTPLALLRTSFSTGVLGSSLRRPGPPVLGTKAHASFGVAKQPPATDSPLEEEGPPPGTHDSHEMHPLVIPWSQP